MDLYNKYRGRKFEELYLTSPFLAVAQACINRTIGTSSEGFPLPHSMVFHSTLPGLGKTTCGRIIGAELNPHLADEERDLIFTGRVNPVVEELNGASFGKIDDARALEERCKQLENSMFGYRYVIIIDEAHKLTPGAQDVMLKVTENIPENIYIIFTTTEIGKMNPYLMSRCEKYAFHPLERGEFGRLMREVAKGETGKELSPEVMDALMSVSCGAPRAAITAYAEYLRTGKVVNSESQEEAVPAYKELLNLLIEAAEREVSWGRHISPRIESMLREHQAEEIRIGIMTRLCGVLLAGDSMRRSTIPLLSHIAESLQRPLDAPQRSSLVGRLFGIWGEALNIRLSSPAGQGTSSSRQGRRDNGSSRGGGDVE